MNKKYLIFIFISFIFTVCASGFSLNFSKEYPLAKATIKVIDDKGVPVKDAFVRLGFYQMKHPKNGVVQKGMTDAEGNYSAEDKTHGELSYLAKKDGYYEAEGEYRDWFTGKGQIKNGKWQPWNPTIEIVLKKIENPVPMYAKRVSSEIPEENIDLGYDLIIGDWVAPYGKGKVSDIIFKCTRKISGDEDFQIKLETKFSNKNDGLCSVIAPSQREGGSKFRLPKVAPKNGYENILTLEFGKMEGKYIQINPMQNYFLRVRTVADENKNIKEAKYGKIHGDFEIVGYIAEKMTLLFTYYLNPDGTRNLEFDPKRNLFEGLSSLEEVNEP